MSRIAKYPVSIPENVQVQITDTAVMVKGPLGEAHQAVLSKVKVVQEDKALQCSPVGESIEANAMSGTMRALLFNMVKGVSEGFTKKLTLVGVGYRAQAKGDSLSLALGYSHPIEHKMPAGIKVETPTQTEIVIKGIDKQKVGQVAAEVRAYRRP
ncbi:MAG: 50S ribosomal protein L6, partial [Pseudomonadota bacterium]|nr:50S ribosomal protein L6 [Pseudomonadota bacterium]